MTKEGLLGYDGETDRLMVRFSDSETSGGMHCGQTLELRCPCCDAWRPCRVEMREKGWCLTKLGILGQHPDWYIGCRVRMEV